MRYIFFVTTLLAVVLFQGCSNRDESNDTNTTQTIDPSAQTLELNIETYELPENNETTVTVRTADGKEVTQESGMVWHFSDVNVTELNGSKLLAKAEGMTTIQAEFNGEYSQEQNVTVYKIIHGHRLPPEPDSKINDSTLLGIDSNHNGVRDDVERAIYLHYKTPVEQAVIMQHMKGIQAVFADANRVMNAVALEKQLGKSGDCILYFYSIKHIEIKYPKYAKNIQINTKERLKAWLDYDNALSGGVYGSDVEDWTEEAFKGVCDFNVTRVLERQP